MTLRGGVVLMTFLSLIGMGWLSQALSPAQDGKVGRVIRPSPARLKTNPLVREPAGLPRRPYGPDSRGRGRWPDRAMLPRARAAAPARAGLGHPLGPGVMEEVGVAVVASNSTTMQVAAP